MFVQHLPRTPVSLYVGVNVVANFLPNLVALTLAWFTGDVVGPSNSNCTNLDKSHVSLRMCNVCVNHKLPNVLRFIITQPKH